MIHGPALMFRAMQAIHLAVCSVSVPAKSKTIARAIMMVQSCRTATIDVGIATTVCRLEAIRVIRRAIKSVI